MTLLRDFTYETAVYLHEHGSATRDEIAATFGRPAGVTGSTLRSMSESLYAIEASGAWSLTPRGVVAMVYTRRVRAATPRTDGRSRKGTPQAHAEHHRIAA